jgi:hypothetical protein
MKLTKEIKALRKSYKKLFESNHLVISHYGRVTCAGVTTGKNRGKVAWAIHSTEDGKFSKKFGEFMALQRLAEDVSLPVECYSEDMLTVMDSLMLAVQD